MITEIRTCKITINEGDEPINGFAFLGPFGGFFVTEEGKAHKSVYSWRPVGGVHIDMSRLELGHDTREIKRLEALIYDAERRIGSSIASGGSQEDFYVQSQITKIKTWSEQLERHRLVLDGLGSQINQGE